MYYYSNNNTNSCSNINLKKSNEFKHNKNGNKQKSYNKGVVILWDNTIKYIKGGEISKNFDNCNIYVTIISTVVTYF